jgi:flavodoxin
MNVRIVYHSDSGNTKKLAMAVSEAAGVPAEEMTGRPELDSVDLLFVGGSVRAFSLEKNCKEFLKSLKDSQAKNVALFSTSGFGKGISKFAVKILKGTGIHLIPEECAVRGGENKKTGETHPDDKDCEKAKEFAKRMVERVSA